MCPDPEALAAFIEGNTYGLEQASIERHIAVCDCCFAHIVFTVRERRAHALREREQRDRQRARRWWLPMAAAAAIAGIAVGILWPRSEKDIMTQLVHAAPHTSRTVRARLSGGFSWAPLRTVMRGGANTRSAEDWEFFSVVGSVLEKTADDQSVHMRHAAAVAHLLVGEQEEATATLQKMVSSTMDPRIWNDLAASLYEQSVRSDGEDMAIAKQALAAVDAALHLDRTLPEALFNRALILESLGRQDIARSAWEGYLAVDPDSGWATEAREHLRLLAPATDAPDASQGPHASQQRDRGNGRELRPDFVAAAHQAARQRAWPLAITFLSLELDGIRERGAERRRADVLLTRARIEMRIGQMDAAATDVAHAREAVEAISDRAARERAEAEVLAIQGALADTPPGSAVDALNKAFDLERHIGRRDRLAELHLARGRALKAGGRIAEAATDFDAGIREVESQASARRTLLLQGSQAAPDEVSWNGLNTRDELFDEVITLAITQGNIAQAFTYAERARSRQPLELTEAVKRHSRDVVIEYVSLPSQLITFVLKDGHLRATACAVTRKALSADITMLMTSVHVGDTAGFRRSASVLFNQLIAQIENDLSDRRRIVFIPDTTLSRVPFAALVAADGTYLVERHVVVVAPSLAQAPRDAARSIASRTQPDVLLIDGPPLFGRAITPLFSARREANAIAALYGPRLTRLPQRWDRSVLGQRGATANIIHFSGHAIAPNDGVDAALVTSRAQGAAGRLTASEIAVMDLRRTDLVVLAACQTVGDPEGGGISLARAFLDAGVNNVVGTLWQIPDAPAAEFFPRFHRYVAEGRSAADALRATQLECIRRNDAPALWAAVQVLAAGGGEQPSSFRRPHILLASTHGRFRPALDTTGRHTWNIRTGCPTGVLRHVPMPSSLTPPLPGGLQAEMQVCDA